MDKKPIESRKVKLLMVNPPDFMALFTKGLKVRGGWKIIKGVPADAKLLTIAYEPSRNGVMLVVESEEYEPVPKNVTPPIQIVEIDINDRHVKKPKAS
jgi:hypothetical protein